MPGGAAADRDCVRHIGAVGVVALDARDQVMLVRQYRHPVGRQLWELPAGLIDVDGEDLVAAARRELAEEAELTAARWDLLVDLHTSPGYSNELIRLYLARDLAPVAEPAHVRAHEEAEMVAAWHSLDEALAMVMSGRITNAAAVGGLLAAAHAKASDWSALRLADTPLPR
ncbi:MAG: NUDIX domain-containing protein [Micromonosporaceae bacterium]|nr:NUDIX domain-containing protein [Micromonosporaceae bacterium]